MQFQVLNLEEWAGEKVRIVLGEICSFMRVCPAGASSLEALIDCFIVNHAKLDQRCEGLDKQSTLNRVKCFFRNVSGLSDDALSTIGYVVKRRSRSRNAILLAISSRWVSGEIVGIDAGCQNPSEPFSNRTSATAAHMSHFSGPYQRAHLGTRKHRRWNYQNSRKFQGENVRPT